MTPTSRPEPAWIDMFDFDKQVATRLPDPLIPRINAVWQERSGDLSLRQRQVSDRSWSAQP
jgi:hypothetical protein